MATMTSPLVNNQLRRYENGQNQEFYIMLVMFVGLAHTKLSYSTEGLSCQFYRTFFKKSTLLEDTSAKQTILRDGHARLFPV